MSPLAALVGKPWSPFGEGPDSFYCWGLVRHVFRVEHDVDLPRVATQETENVLAIKRAARISGWRRSESTTPEPADIVVMDLPTGVHVGYVMRANGQIGVLNSREGAGVIFEKWNDATRGIQFELWRRA